MKYILITVIDREILTEKFVTFEEAHHRMIEEFCRYSGIDEAQCTEEESECDGEFGYCKWNAYYNDNGRDTYYDWQIVEIGENDQEQQH